MPIYAYRCERCGHAKDVLQRIADPVLTVCPSCGQDSFRKQVTAAGFQLKGSGWYVTDFRGDKPSGKAPDGDSAAAKAPGEAAEKGVDASGAGTATSGAAPAEAPASSVKTEPVASPAPPAPGKAG